MIDRNSRDIGAKVLREFVEGTITNEEFEEKYPKSENDPALPEIYFQIWFFYSDIREHKLEGRNSLNDEQSTFIARCLLFLESDIEFEWPRQKFRPWHSILRLFGLEWETEETGIGNENVWPFYTIEQYEQTCSKLGRQKR